MSVSDKIRKYDQIVYDSTIVDVASYNDDKLEAIHRDLFADALENMFNELFRGKYSSVDDLLDHYRMQEIRDTEYYKASKIILQKKTFPFDRFNIDLSSWWNDFQGEIIASSIDDKLIDEEDKTYGKLVYVDYVAGRSKFINRMNGKEFWVQNSCVKDRLGDRLLEDTFSEMYKNIER